VGLTVRKVDYGLEDPVFTSRQEARDFLFSKTSRPALEPT